MHGKSEAFFNPQYQADSKYDGSMIYLPVHLKASHHITAGNTDPRAALQTSQRTGQPLAGDIAVFSQLCCHKDVTLKPDCRKTEGLLFPSCWA